MHPSSTQPATPAVEQGEGKHSSGSRLDLIQDVTAALMNKGISPSVAKRLASHYKRQQILEKIEFLAYLQETNPTGVKRPAGWLRRAIEEDYSRPDGFSSQAEREAEAKASERQQHDTHDEAMRIVQEAANHVQEEKRRTAHLEAIKRRYHTSEREEHVWLKIVSHLVATGPIQTKTHLTGSHLISLSDQHAVIWFPQRFAQWYAQHRFSFAIQRLLAKHLKVGIEAVTLTFVTPDQERRRGE